MPAPKNELKAALARGEMQVGIWLGLASPVGAELAATCGFDWCLIDGEHGPNDITSIRGQLQAVQGQGTQAVVRVPASQDWMLKQVLDMGAQSVLVPMVNTAADARRVARACHYPPFGTRGVGADMVRASRYNAITDYALTANEEICVMVQVESAEAIENIDQIAATQGVDVVFVGPSDLSSDMGFHAQPDAPQVLAAIDHAAKRIRAAGKTAGIISGNPEKFAGLRDQGFTFLGVGAEVMVLADALRTLSATARDKTG